MFICEYSANTNTITCNDCLQQNLLQSFSDYAFLLTKRSICLKAPDLQWLYLVNNNKKIYVKQNINNKHIMPSVVVYLKSFTL